MTQYGFYFDSTRCTGAAPARWPAKTTTTCPPTTLSAACSTTRVAIGKTTVTVPLSRRAGPTTCPWPATTVQCRPAWPIAPKAPWKRMPIPGSCPAKQEKCIGCGTCVKSCPYEVPVVDTETMKSAKCDGCASRVAEGKMPICVDACPLRALEFGDIEKLRAAHPGTVDGIAPMAPPDATKPSVAILACRPPKTAVTPPAPSRIRRSGKR